MSHDVATQEEEARRLDALTVEGSLLFLVRIFDSAADQGVTLQLPAEICRTAARRCRAAVALLEQEYSR